MATTKSIDVRAVCPKHGPVTKITLLGGTRFCSICLSQYLETAGVPIIRMETVENEVDDSIYSYECPHCGKLRDTGHEACPHCGKQDEKRDEHYFCPHCNNLMEDGHGACPFCGY